MRQGTGLLGDRYELQGVVASGGMGRVWRARDTVLGRPVAVKLLRSEFTDNPVFLTRFRAEAQHAALLNHPNIAAVHDYGETMDDDGERLAYLVMELVDGEPLSALLAREGRLDVPRTLRIMRQTAAALSAAHAAGVVHRDVKPGNVLVRTDSVVKITDFGIAWSASTAPVTRTGQVVGTAHYLSPEQAQGGKATSASDVYSLGVMVYECLTGRRPIDGESPVQIALKQIHEEPAPLPPDVPAPVRQFVARAMAKDPAQRIPDGAALVATIDRLLAPGVAELGDRPTVVGVPPVPAGMPPTAVLPVTATAVEDGAAGAGVGAGGGAERRRGSRRTAGVLMAAVLALAAVVVAVVVLGRSAGSGSATAGAVARTGDATPVGASLSSPSPTPAVSTTPSPPPAPSPPPVPTPAPTPTVRLAAADWVGRPLAAVQAELAALGLKVAPVPVVMRSRPAGQVLGVQPVGVVLPGQTVSVTYVVAPPATTTAASRQNDKPGRGDGQRKGKKDD